MLGYTYDEAIKICDDLLTAAYNARGGQGGKDSNAILKGLELIEGLLAEGYIDENTFYG